MAKYTKKYYENIFYRILEIYRYYGNDLTNILEQIKQTNAIAYNNFKKICFTVNKKYELKQIIEINKFYENLLELIPKEVECIATLSAKYLNSKNTNLDIEEEFMIKNYDYLLMITLFCEEFFNENILSSLIVNSKSNNLNGTNQNISINIKKENDKIITDINIPKRLQLTYKIGSINNKNSSNKS